MVIFISMTKKKIEEKLEWVPYILCFVILEHQLKVLLSLESKINTISQVFASQLSLTIQNTNVRS